MTDAAAAERAAMAAVAKHCSGTWEGGDPRSSCLTIGGQRIGVRIALLAPRAAARSAAALPRLREDRVAQRVVRDLETALAECTPRERTVIVTLGAPIRVPNRLVVALTERIGDHLAHDGLGADAGFDLLGNRVRFHVARGGAAWTSRAHVFVFSGDPAPRDLADAMVALRDRVIAEARTRAPRGFSGERWLVLAGGARIADAATYRRAASRMRLPDAFARILLVSDDGRVEILAERA